MKTSVFVFALLIFSGNSFANNMVSGAAQNLKTPKIDQRIENQKMKVDQAIQNGKLTEEQAQKAKESIQAVEAKKAELSQDGKLTKEERKEIHQQLNENVRKARMNRHIKRQQQKK